MNLLFSPVLANIYYIGGGGLGLVVVIVLVVSRSCPTSWRPGWFWSTGDSKRE
jgi:hypothetical protein